MRVAATGARNGAGCQPGVREGLRRVDRLRFHRDFVKQTVTLRVVP